MDNVIQIMRDSSGHPNFIELSNAERLCGRENYDFYCFLIWPFIEACWLGAISLVGLTPPLGGPQDVWIDMKKAQDAAQLVRPIAPLMPLFLLTSESLQLGKTLYHQGDLSYFEAVNKETLRNAHQRFAEEGIILLAKTKGPRAAITMRLADGWIPERDLETGKLLDRGRLWDFVELIAQSRREG